MVIDVGPSVTRRLRTFHLPSPADVRDTVSAEHGICPVLPEPYCGDFASFRKYWKACLKQLSDGPSIRRVWFLRTNDDSVLDAYFTLSLKLPKMKVHKNLARDPEGLDDVTIEFIERKRLTLVPGVGWLMDSGHIGVFSWDPGSPDYRRALGVKEQLAKVADEAYTED